MHTRILTLSLTGRRDLLTVRQRAREVAGLLGFDPAERAAIAAAAFEIARRAAEAGGDSVHFELSGDTFQIVPGRPRVRTRRRTPLDPLGARRLLRQLRRRPGTATGAVRVERPLRKAALPLDRHDLAWAAESLARLSPPDAFGEIRRQNDEMLRAVRDRLAAPDTGPDQESPAA